MGSSKNIGKVYNGLKIIDSVYKLTKTGKTKQSYYVTECIYCGKIKEFQANHTLKARSVCDCQKVKHDHNANGMSNSPLYGVYRGIISRTTNPQHKAYKNYGGRGITICDEWLNDFMAFYQWCMSNGYKKGLTIDRIDNNKGYSPDNCRVISFKEQQNNKRTNHRLEYNGETHTISEWAEILGMKQKTLARRIDNNWTVEKALTTKVKKRRNLV